jgi:hypothetical protein
LAVQNGPGRGRSSARTWHVAGWTSWLPPCRIVYSLRMHQDSLNSSFGVVVTMLLVLLSIEAAKSIASPLSSWCHHFDRRFDFMRPKTDGEQSTCARGVLLTSSLCKRRNGYSLLAVRKEAGAQCHSIVLECRFSHQFCLGMPMANWPPFDTPLLLDPLEIASRCRLESQRTSFEEERLLASHFLGWFWWLK